MKQNDGWSKISEDNIAESKFVDSPIGVLPDGGYGGNGNFSRASILWLEWESKQRDVAIRHALSGGEMKVMKPGGGYYRLDVFRLTLKLVKRLPWNTWVVFGIHVLHAMKRIPVTRPFSKLLVSSILKCSKRD